MFRTLAALVCFSLSFVCIAKPLVIAHRGASGYLPEHTLEAFILAYSQGADFIEQDLVLSKDNVPIVLHDIHLETVTDVEQVFPSRGRDDGRFYALDFTLAELKTLRVHERQDKNGKQVFPGRFNGQSDFRIASFEEQLDLMKQLNRQFGKKVGIYPEIKSPAWHKKQGRDISKIVLSILRKYNLDDHEKPVYVQCFDFDETKRLRNELGAKVKLVQLIGENDWAESSTDYDILRSPMGLKKIAQVADGIGPWIPQLIDLNGMKPTSLTVDAKKAGLAIHPYTFRKDQLPEGMTAKQSLDLLFSVLQVDGVFTDFTDTVVKHLELVSIEDRKSQN